MPKICFARVSLCKFQFLTSVDLKWPWISTEINRLLVLIIGDLHTKYELLQSFAHHVDAFTRIFSIWPLLTSNDFGSLHKSIGLYSPWRTYIPNMRLIRFPLIKLTCLQGFQFLTSVDLKLPWNSTKNIIVLSPHMDNLYAKFEFVDICVLQLSCLQAASRTQTHTHAHTLARTHTYTHARVTA